MCIYTYIYMCIYTFIFIYKYMYLFPHTLGPGGGGFGGVVGCRAARRSGASQNRSGRCAGRRREVCDAFRRGEGQAARSAAKD